MHPTWVADAACIFNQRHVVALEQQTPPFGVHLVLSQHLYSLFKVLVLLNSLLLESLFGFFGFLHFQLLFFLRA